MSEDAGTERRRDGEKERRDEGEKRRNQHYRSAVSTNNSVIFSVN